MTQRPAEGGRFARGGRRELEENRDRGDRGMRRGRRSESIGDAMESSTTRRNQDQSYRRGSEGSRNAPQEESHATTFKSYDRPARGMRRGRRSESVGDAIESSTTNNKGYRPVAKGRQNTHKKNSHNSTLKSYEERQTLRSTR